jgi:hypothetical protein
MHIAIGAQIWIPCEVKPGPFSNERLVRVVSKAGEWVGFVPVASLRKIVESGRSWASATVLDVDDETVTVQFSGHPITPTVFRSDRVGVEPRVALQA